MQALNKIKNTERAFQSIISYFQLFHMFIDSLYFISLLKPENSTSITSIPSANKNQKKKSQDALFVFLRPTSFLHYSLLKLVYKKYLIIYHAT